MLKSEYDEYLQSEHWKIVSKESRRLADYRCQVCNSCDNVLHVHHRTYERIGNELQQDLVCLCDKCHELFHTGGTKIENEINFQAIGMVSYFISDLHADSEIIKNLSEQWNNYVERSILPEIYKVIKQ
jgi:predicted metal-binding protein